MKINSPILFCCYNRLDMIKKSLDIIRNIECKKIYISIDGPKNDEIEKNINQEIIKYITSIQFKSNTEFLIRKENLGCKIAISSAIDWFFSNEESGIILEEDLLPTDTFFKFCDYALEKYEDKSSVMMISGTNYIGSGLVSNKYFFSEHFLIWGWATWKRAWKLYDVEMLNWQKDDVKKKIQNRYSEKEYKFLQNKFNSFLDDYSDTWDIQWYFACINNSGLTVMPEANLVSNIGIEGTHSNKYYKTLFLKHGKIEIEKLKSPNTIKRNIEFDMKIHKKFHFENFLLKKIKAKIKKIFFKKL